MMKLLLQYKADPDAKGSIYKPLILATQEGNVFMQKLLLKHGANPNISEQDEQHGYTALIACVYNDDCPEFKIKKLALQLLAYNADTTITYRDLTAEQWAQKNGFHDIANIIKNYYPSKKELFEIVQKKEQEITEQDIEKVKRLATKITFKIKDDKGNTPLHYCVANRHQRLSEICLQVLPTLIKKKNKNGETPLHLAAINNYQFLNFVINKLKIVWQEKTSNA